jgi:hypothetical protein
VRYARLALVSIVVAAAASPVVPASAAVTSLEAESMAVTPAGSGSVYSDATASGGAALGLWTSAQATTNVSLSAPASAVSVRAKGQLCKGAPAMTVSIDGKATGATAVSATVWTEYSVAVTIPAGAHTLSVAFANPYRNGRCSRALGLDRITVQTADTSGSGTVLDDFNGPAGTPPSSQYWDYDTGQWNSNGQLQNYTNSTQNIRLDGNGDLIIQALKTPTGYTSGRLVTRGKVNMVYGTMSARIKMPSGRGIGPAFWLLGSNVNTVGWPQCGEIDLMELPKLATYYYTTLHGPWVQRPAGASVDYMVGTQGPIADLSTDFHTYWVRRSPGQVVIGVDNTTLGTYTKAALSSNQQWVFDDQPMYGILNISVGDNSSGVPDATTPWPATMLVDWFRVDPT